MVLTPTLATETPEVGWLDPTQDYDLVMGRIKDWVAFTPLQNATGDPAISLPLATTANGLPQGMMFGAGAGREATADRARLRARGGGSVCPDPGLSSSRLRAIRPDRQGCVKFSVGVTHRPL